MIITALMSLNVVVMLKLITYGIKKNNNINNIIIKNDEHHKIISQK